MFDVDHFKVYNDQNGHVSGDRLLQSLSRLVQDNLRRDTMFGRYGGEEFLIIFPGLRREQAIAAAENIRKAIAGYAFAHAGAQPLGCVSISGGVAECPARRKERAGLVRAADEALYRAKRAGRNRVLAHEPVYMGESAPQADYTPEPGTLLSLAMITPPAGVPSLAAALAIRRRSPRPSKPPRPTRPSICEARPGRRSRLSSRRPTRTRRRAPSRLASRPRGRPPRGTPSSRRRTAAGSRPSARARSRRAP